MAGEKTVIVGIGEFRVARAPAVLITHNLGSCIGVALYDVRQRIGGLAHITLPSYKAMGSPQGKEVKFADTAIPLMLKEMEKMGAHRSFMIAKIAGGADMFGLPGNFSEMDIGRQNVEAVKDCLKRCGINLVAEEVLGSIPRTMELDLITGRVILRTSQKKTRFL